MEIDLIAGLSKPKLELAALETPELLGGDIPDFTALLSDDTPDDSSILELTPSLESLAHVSLAMPQEKGQAPEIETRLNADLSANADVIIAPDTTIIAVQPAAPQLQMKVEPAALDQPVAKATIEPNLANFAQPKPDQAQKHIEIVPMPAEKSVHPTEPVPWQTRGKTAELPAPITANPRPELKVATAQPQPIRAENPIIAEPDRAPQINMARHPVQTAPKIGGPIQAQPALQTAFTNLEMRVDDPAEVQFGIKIERQSIDIAQPSRASAPAAPVANQIAAQLPQVLTKANKQTIELRLDPPELGRVTIHLTTNDQHVTAQVVADRVDTIDLMRRHAELLSATLARAGFSQADLSFQQGQSQNGKAEFEQFHAITEDFEGDEPAITAPTLSGQDGRLDIRL